ncbi:hypothetical protein NC653_009785 [Populus alba x Populus x berolinensis]|uniref:Uncharacterized protein n=1 Tax=Populus alba x Populus x berolinensis TaxID=444605 RepID=A0AAD6RAB3_9ROSI|nr:hypothetical protein NC653_009785 [Populus alba x Populus x berolinensis]
MHARRDYNHNRKLHSSRPHDIATTQFKSTDIQCPCFIDFQRQTNLLGDSCQYQTDYILKK